MPARLLLVSFRKHPDFTTMQCKSLLAFLFLIFTLPEIRLVTVVQHNILRLTPAVEPFMYNPFLLARCTQKASFTAILILSESLMCTNLYLLNIMKASFIVIVLCMLIILGVLMNILTED